ncbi:MAG: hypothetical protein KC646_00045 [Candidatus Cloacimonetes bacterium]|nr:hypothetical protein [Candidatus Cloacimonadota bacterium]
MSSGDLTPDEIESLMDGTFGLEDSNSEIDNDKSTQQLQKLKRQSYTEKLDNLQDAIAGALDVFSSYLSKNCEVLKVSILPENKIAQIVRKKELVVKVASSIGDIYLTIDSLILVEFLDMLGSNNTNDIESVYSQEYYPFFCDLMGIFYNKMARLAGLGGKLRFEKPQQITDKEIDTQCERIAFRYRCESEDSEFVNVCVLVPHPQEWDLTYIEKPMIQANTYAYSGDSNYFALVYQSALKMGYLAKLQACSNLFMYLASKARNEGLYSIEEDVTKIPWSLTKDSLNYYLEGYFFEHEKYSQSAIDGHKRKVKYILSKLVLGPRDSYCPAGTLLSKNEAETSSSLNPSFDELCKLDFAAYFLETSQSYDDVERKQLIDRIIHFEEAFCKMSWLGTELIYEGTGSTRMQYILKTISDEFTI